MADKKEYFVNGKKVTRQEYMMAERNAGFYPKTEGQPATGSFSNGKVSGYIKYA